MEIQNKNKALFDNNDMPILLINPQTGEIIEVNKAAELFYGITNERIKNKNFFEISRFTRNILVEKLKNAAENIKNRWESVHIDRDTNLYDVKISTQPVEINGEKLLFITITDFKEKQEYLNFNELNELQKRMKQTEQIGVFQLDKNKQCVYCNDFFLKIFGFDDFCFELNCILKKLSDKYRQKIIAEVDKLDYENNGFQIEIEWWKGKDLKFLYFMLNAVFDTNRNLTGYIGVCIDLTETKRINEQLHEKSLFIQRVAEQTPNIIYIYDVENEKNIYINRDLRKILGYDNDELPDDSLEIVKKLMHPEDLEQFIEYEKKTKNWTKEYVQIFQMRLKAKDGSWYWFIGREQEFLRRNGKIVNIIGVLTDITEIKRAEQLLWENERKLKDAQRIAKLGYWELDLNTGNLYWSDETYRIFGVDTEKKDITSEFFLSFVPSEEHHFFDKALKKHVEEGEKYQVMHKIILRDGTEKYVLERCYAVYDDNNKPVKCLGTVLDITERVLTEKKLKEQNEEFHSLYEEYKSQNEELRKAKEKAELSNNLKTEFLHNLSHEIRTPMNGIIGFSELLLDDDVSDDKKKFYAKMIINSGKQLLRVIDDILEISKLETKQITVYNRPVSLNAFLLNLFSIFDFKAKEKNLPLYLKKEIPDGKDLIYVDDLKLNKIISNLLENAMKYTQSGFVELGAKIVDDEVHIYVKDTGSGIPEKMQNVIFERFRRANDNLNKITDGIGLGLAIAKENAELLNGKILLQSEVGKGSVFTLVIPYKPVENQTENKSETGGKGKILIAEDEEINFVYFEIILRKEFPEINILHAKNGKEAVEFAEKYPDISLVFMDMKMPVMNGLEAIEIIKKIKPELPVYALTAYTVEDDVKKAITAGCNGFLTKPYDKEKIFSIIRECLKF